MFRTKWFTFITAVPVSIIALSLVLFPEEALKASVKGLEIWWKIVFPSLLPFFITSELLIAFGVVNFFGIVLEPVMKPLFRVPGVGGFVWAMGMVAGNPAGAKLTVRLRNEKIISRQEAERIVAFTSSANPLFIFGAVSAGFFQNEKIGVLFASAHYLSNIFVGIFMRFFGKKVGSGEERKKFRLKDAFEQMHRTRIGNKRPFGKILGDAVTSSIQTLLMIGGFIIFFSVLNRLFTLIHITDVFTYLISPIFSILHLPTEFSFPFLSGLFEMTIGSQMISETNAEIFEKAIVVSFLLAFGGFSIQAQVGSILAQSDIRFQPFFIARCLQGLFASLLTILLWKPVYETGMFSKGSEVTSVFSLLEQSVFVQIFEFFARTGPLLTIGSIIIYIVLYIHKHFSLRNRLN
ncbi:sporulation integral membrane protein YlbJ [Fervidibacillus albus]|uniref:Sporulation integral membrane protein YlbJ n=1 Tax=Fervidibacillus albus TaxID=2980026 RepID=A0A9E8LVT1_9BACI|nr:sporulation integral membrane protein YlbJ [Fervidibacillus albus]WAA10613.1 sporulation integral membrane protein YlbJ [Fervidibacillus albus]